MRSWANFNVNVIFVITTGGKTIPIWIISSEFIKFWILNKSRSGILNKKKCPRVVAGVPADFESRHQKLSIDAKILLEDHLWRFRVLLALYDQTIYIMSSYYPYDRLFNITKNHCSFTTYANVIEFVLIPSYTN